MRLHSLLNLPEDVLLVVCDHLELAGRIPLQTIPRFEDHFLTYLLVGGHSRNPLLDFSGTCRTIRRLCIPRIFKFIHLDTSPENSDPPSVLLSYARGCFIDHHGVLPGRRSALSILASNLRKVYFRDNIGLLPDILQLQGLEILAASQADWNSIQTHVPLTTIRAPLRVVRFCYPVRFKSMAHESVELSREIQWIEEICAQVHMRLEVLALPAESFRVSFVATSPWPQLREIFLYGCNPVLDLPLWGLFDVAPKLRVFTLCAALPRGHAPPVLFPRGLHGPPDISALRRFTMASPSPDDQIFTHLPPELNELSLRDMPRFYERCRYPNDYDAVDSAYDPRILSCTDALNIFRNLRCCAALRHLELVVTEDERELELLDYIATSCPRLEGLDLHCYRNVSAFVDLMHAPLAVPIDALARALSAFPALRTLRLNIDTPWEEFTISRHCTSWRRDGVPYAAALAKIVAEAVPWLHIVCVLARQASRKAEWRIWAVRARADGTVELDKVESRNGIEFLKR